MDGLQSLIQCPTDRFTCRLLESSLVKLTLAPVKHRGKMLSYLIIVSCSEGKKLTLEEEGISRGALLTSEGAVIVVSVVTAACSIVAAEEERWNGQGI